MNCFVLLQYDRHDWVAPGINHLQDWLLSLLSDSLIVRGKIIVNNNSTDLGFDWIELDGQILESNPIWPIKYMYVEIEAIFKIIVWTLCYTILSTRVHCWVDIHAL